MSLVVELKTSLHRMVPLKAILHSYCREPLSRKEDFRADDDMFLGFEFGCYMNRRRGLEILVERLLRRATPMQSCLKPRTPTNAF